MVKDLWSETVLAARRRAIEQGGRNTSVAKTKANYAGRCIRPVTVEMRGVPLRKGKGRTSTMGATHFLELEVPCRKCSACLKQRASMWSRRARAEVSACVGGNRTWFVTLTVKPELRFILHARCRQRQWKRGIDFDAMPPDEKLKLLSKQTGLLITLWLKRLRKKTQTSFRYLCVMEAHKDGFPHHHLLVHESTGRITERDIRLSWSENGFAMAKLVPDDDGGKACWYVCKYLTKSALARVRASARYGGCVERTAPETS